MIYDENEDIRGQGKEEDHHPHSHLDAQLLPLSEHRADHSDTRRFLPTRLHRSITPFLFLLESMRRDVRILLVGDGSSLFYLGLCWQNLT